MVGSAFASVALRRACGGKALPEQLTANLAVAAASAVPAATIVATGAIAAVGLARPAIVIEVIAVSGVDKPGIWVRCGLEHAARDLRWGGAVIGAAENRASQEK